MTDHRHSPDPPPAGGTVGSSLGGSSKGGAPVSPDTPLSAGDLKADIDEIARRVKERIDQEAADDETPADNGVDLKFIAECLAANELGDGLLYKAVNDGQVIFNKAMDGWLSWLAHHWTVDTMGRARALVERVVEQYAELLAYTIRQAKDAEANDDPSGNLGWLRSQIKKLRGRINLLHSRGRAHNCLDFSHNCAEPMAIKGDEIDCRPMLLACANGVINLATGALEPGRQDQYLLKASPVSWAGIDAPAALWEKTLMEILSGDERLFSFLQRLFGYALIGEVRESMIAVMTGIGRNGKSLIVEVLSEILGPMAGAVRSEMLLDQSRLASSSGPTPDIMGMRGKLMAFASETDDGCRVSPSRVKWLTGKDKLTGRNPHDKHEIQFSPTHTLFLLTNHKPHAPADDFAFWERVVLIPFKLSFVTRRPRNNSERVADPLLASKLVDEYPGILAWMVRGCLDYQERGLDPPPVVKEAVEEYQRDEDIIADFIEECCVVGETLKVGATAMYDIFERWWKKNVSKNVPKQKRFGSLMGRRFERVKDSVYKYKGVGLLDGVEDLFNDHFGPSGR